MKIFVLVILIAVVAGGVWGAYELLNDEDIGSRGEAIIEDPDRFVGEEVTVTGTVESSSPRRSRSATAHGAKRC